MAQSLQSDLEIQKTALSSLIQRIDVTQDGKVGVEFYINTRALGNTRTGQYSPCGLPSTTFILGSIFHFLPEANSYLRYLFFMISFSKCNSQNINLRFHRLFLQTLII